MHLIHWSLVRIQFYGGNNHGERDSVSLYKGGMWALPVRPQVGSRAKPPYQGVGETKEAERFLMF